MSEELSSNTYNGKDSLSCEDVKPLTDFVNDRKKMLEEAFSAVGRDKLKTMLPSFLKDSLLDEVKLICYEELRSLSDDELRAVLEGKDEQEISCLGDKKILSSIDICSQGSGATCGYEVCKSEDTTSTCDSKSKDILEIGISEEEVTCLLKEIPNSQDFSKDLTDMICQSKETNLCVSEQQHLLGDDSATNEDSFQGQASALGADENSLDLLELEHRARSIRSLIMQCDAEEENEMHCLVEYESENCQYTENDNFTGSHNKISVESSIKAFPSIKSNLKNGAKKMDISGNHQTAAYEISNNSITTIESVFQNKSQVSLTTTNLNDNKDLKISSYSAEAEEKREKNINKVVSTSKMCTKLRERIKRTQKLRRFKEGNTEAKTVILGTVEEYKSLNTK